MAQSGPRRASPTTAEPQAERKVFGSGAMRKEVNWTWRTVRDVEIVNVSFLTVLAGCRARCPECRPEIRVGASHAATAAVSSRPIAASHDSQHNSCPIHCQSTGVHGIRQRAQRSHIFSRLTCLQAALEEKKLSMPCCAFCTEDWRTIGLFSI